MKLIKWYREITPENDRYGKLSPMQKFVQFTRDILFTSLAVFYGGAIVMVVFFLFLYSGFLIVCGLERLIR